MVQNNMAEATVPSEIADFVSLLVDHELKESKAIAIAKFISRTGSPKVFEEPAELAEFLARYPRDLAPIQRRRVLEEHFATRGVKVPEELLTRTGLHPKDALQAQKEEERKRKIASGALWTVALNDKGLPSVRMIKDASEPGTTLEEATKAAKQIGKEVGGEEALVSYNESLGKHMPNFKSDFVKQHPAAAWAVAKQMDKAMAEGDTIDPMDSFIDQMTKIESMKELVGGRTEARGGTVSEIIAAAKELRSLAGDGEAGALKELRAEMTKLREDQHQAELKRRDEQNAGLVTVIQEYRGEIIKLRDEIEKNKMATGRTAYDLLGDLVQKVPNRDDVRAMVMEIAGKGPKLLTRGIGERERMLEGMAVNIEQAAELRNVEDWWFGLGGEPTIYRTPTPAQKLPPLKEPSPIKEPPAQEPSAPTVYE